MAHGCAVWPDPDTANIMLVPAGPAAIRPCLGHQFINTSAQLNARLV
jgi:hypothetical protein